MGDQLKENQNSFGNKGDSFLPSEKEKFERQKKLRKEKFDNQLRNDYQRIKKKK